MNTVRAWARQFDRAAWRERIEVALVLLTLYLSTAVAFGIFLGIAWRVAEWVIWLGVPIAKPFTIMPL